MNAPISGDSLCFETPVCDSPFEFEIRINLVRGAAGCKCNGGSLLHVETDSHITRESVLESLCSSQSPPLVGNFARPIRSTAEITKLQCTCRFAASIATQGTLVLCRAYGCWRMLPTSSRSNNVKASLSCNPADTNPPRIVMDQSSVPSSINIACLK